MSTALAPRRQRFSGPRDIEQVDDGEVAAVARSRAVCNGCRVPGSSPLVIARAQTGRAAQLSRFAHSDIYADRHNAGDTILNIARDTLSGR